MERGVQSGGVAGDWLGGRCTGFSCVGRASGAAGAGPTCVRKTDPAGVWPRAQAGRAPSLFRQQMALAAKMRGPGSRAEPSWRDWFLRRQPGGKRFHGQRLSLQGRQTGLLMEASGSGGEPGRPPVGWAMMMGVEWGAEQRVPGSRRRACVTSRWGLADASPGCLCSGPCPAGSSH